MTKRLILIAVFLLLGVTIGAAQPQAVTAHSRAHATSVCYLTGLSGAAQQENLLFCANGQQIDHSVYNDTICLAKTMRIVVGIPEPATQTVDWAGNQVTDVEYSRGYHAEHHDLTNVTYNTVRIYSPSDAQIWVGTSATGAGTC